MKSIQHVQGFDTTSLTGSFVLLMLAMHPEYQERVFEELQSIFPDQSSNVTSADLNQLQYTNLFIKETMRLNPAAPFITRVTKADITIGMLNTCFQTQCSYCTAFVSYLDNVVVPAGVEIVIPIIQIQRNKSVWGPNADVFDPDNFLPDNLSTKHPFAYLPFGGGPRNCIGNKYAYMSVRFFVCWLVRHFRFSTIMRFEDMQYRMCISLKLTNGYMLEVHRREEY